MAATRYRVRRRGSALGTNPKSVGGIDGVEALPKRGAMTMLGKKFETGSCSEIPACANHALSQALCQRAKRSITSQVKRTGWTREQMDGRESLQAICRACYVAKTAREARGLLARLCPERLSRGLDAAGHAWYQARHPACRVLRSGVAFCKNRLLKRVFQQLNISLSALAGVVNDHVFKHWVHENVMPFQSRRVCELVCRWRNGTSTYMFWC